VFHTWFQVSLARNWWGLVRLIGFRWFSNSQEEGGFPGKPGLIIWRKLKTWQGKGFKKAFGREPTQGLRGGGENFLSKEKGLG